ncbi:MAG: hypothetical protein HON14_12860 [Rhodospirillaceae bacterium]|nr:hypothetical protein [Rhodospirillaceae bacterium]MBT4588798.1 hypothetical protein [Rhodospirillaceae bacterium]MBT4940018.1 hypothetical protein [Rhodospirillaceae bacterium]MBT5941333.1 hypothetical protein [Rhodospirillaceae bacterium]MBT7266368.1 hypothetical protein [Rhodospirillaceae bacterium]
MKQIRFKTTSERAVTDTLDYNPHLKPWSRTEPNQVAGKGTIEKPDEVENIIYQTRATPPTEYEDRLGEALSEIFEADADELPEVVAKLNDMGVQAPYGEAWTEESFQAEMKRLGA